MIRDGLGKQCGFGIHAAGLTTPLCLLTFAFGVSNVFRLSWMRFHRKSGNGLRRAAVATLRAGEQLLEFPRCWAKMKGNNKARRRLGFKLWFGPKTNTEKPSNETNEQSITSPAPNLT